MEDISKTDIYELLNISITADEKEVKSAYRKKALSCHPDKNPNNPQAAELFQQLTRALEVLTDAKARASYDKVLKARKEAQIRNRELDSKRKKFKEDLEARERAAARDTKSEEKKLQEEIVRLRKESVRLVQEEMERMAEEIRRERERIGFRREEKPDSQNLPKLKVKWTVHKSSRSDTYSENDLHKILGKHGHITCLMISKRKRGTAVVEFSTIESAKSAVSSQYDDLDVPLKVSWLGDPPTETKPASFSQDSSSIPTLQKPPPPVALHGSQSSKMSFEEYESMVLMRMRQAAERQKLIKQMEEGGGTIPSVQKAPPPVTLAGSSASASRDYESIGMMKIRQSAERQKLIKQMEEEDNE